MSPPYLHLFNKQVYTEGLFFLRGRSPSLKPHVVEEQDDHTTNFWPIVLLACSIQILVGNEPRSILYFYLKVTAIDLSVTHTPFAADLLAQHDEAGHDACSVRAVLNTQVSDVSLTHHQQLLRAEIHELSGNCGKCVA